MCIFTDVEEWIKMCAVRHEILSGNVQTDGAGTRCVDVVVASLAVRTQRHRLTLLIVDDKELRLTD